MGFEWGLIVLNLLLVLLLVLLNGFFVAAEFSLVKVRTTRLQQLHNEGIGKAKYALAVTRKLDAYLSATQLGITLASLGLGWVGEPAISHLIVDPLFVMLGWHNEWFSSAISIFIGFATITFLHIVLGELAPKSLAIQKSEAASLWLSAPLLLFYKLFFPAIWVLNGAANRMLRWIGVEPVSEQDVHTEEEIRILMNQSAKSGHIDKDEMALFDNIFEFSERVAREIMLPRTDMECLYAERSFAENLNIVYKTKHTRYPVARHDKDTIIGFVHITDLLTADPDEDHGLDSFVRPVLMVPESMEISHVLKLMQRKHSQIVIVVDEYGGTAGLLTTEDILEEIVGEIHDEFDENERPSIEKKGDVYSVDGRVLLEDLDELLALGIEDEEVDSIGGWLFTRLEGAVSKGTKLRHGPFEFEIAEVRKLRIMRVCIRRVEQRPAEEQEEEHK